MNKEIYCVYMDDDGGFVAGLFDNMNAAKECYRYHATYFPRTSLITIRTDMIGSEFIEPEFD
jgi:hypothetical protein